MLHIILSPGFLGGDKGRPSSKEVVSIVVDMDDVTVGDFSRVPMVEFRLPGGAVGNDDDGDESRGSDTRSLLLHMRNTMDAREISHT